ncbi:peptidoglycan-associated lipoprotein Pal [Desulfatitalea alkaliphila]|uniref:Peptidoglycan-associated lipoprotein n=1 Tax=Desulfatitalea alkaliphila TaxID=2929485 RepID=A0AA41UIW3_9BACT|nr:peptidoglycan-associated lipoprotein Pal [Desulfatitalea alkaliphila]MCJ8500534.1 peptidoglycan-associated lipoprotein Pal [Desulfatitalea alkaliphila]
MKSKNWLALALAMVLAVTFLTVSCAKKAVEAEPAPAPAPTVTTPTDAERQAAEAAERARLEEERLRAEAAAAQAAKAAFVNENVHFDFDSSALTPRAQQVLRAKAEYLRANSALRVVIEGHCDERGTAAYNMALGERRADSAKAFLVNLGIAENRIGTISYGEERPIDPRSNEEAWAKNRRAQFVIR